MFILATLEQRTVLSSSYTERQIIHSAIFAFVVPNEDILLSPPPPPPPPPTLFLSFIFPVVPKSESDVPKIESL